MRGPENTTTTPEPDVPAGAVRELSTGAVIAVLFAEAMSSVRLFGLGERVGFAWYLAWLLPGALDVYALTMLRFSSRIPTGHRLRRKAMNEAILALVITVGCNALYEAVTAFALQLPAWAPGALYVFVSALAPFVAGMIIHFHASIGHGAAASAAVSAAPQQQPPSETAPPHMERRTLAPHAALAFAAALSGAAAEALRQSRDAAAAAMQQNDDAAAEDAAPQQDDAAAPAMPQETAEPPAPQTPAAPVVPPAAAEPAAQQPDAPAAANDVTRLVPKDERPAVVIELMARHGIDNVSGGTVRDAIGVSRDTGIRDIRDVKKLPDLVERVAEARRRLIEAGEQVAEDPTEAAVEPDRELVLA